MYENHQRFSLVARRETRKAANEKRKISWNNENNGGRKCRISWIAYQYQQRKTSKNIRLKWRKINGEGENENATQRKWNPGVKTWKKAGIEEAKLKIIVKMS
jgi:hypothetical protein